MTINEKKLTKKLFTDLISAFRQDITKKRYASHEELLDYCNRSANPVGRLILEIFEVTNEKSFEYSDNICTALQLTNFYQDISIDYLKDRIYIPISDLIFFQVEEQQFKEQIFDDKFAALLKKQIIIAKNLFDSGERLIPYLEGRLKVEIAWTILGGMEILSAIEKINYNTLDKRPSLSKFKYLILFFRSFIYARRIGKKYFKKE